MINNPNFILTTYSDSSDQLSNPNLELLSESSFCRFYGNNKEQFFIDDISVFIDGYVIPRNEIFSTYCKLNNQELVRELYKEYGFDFVKYVKGIFCILIINDQEVHLFTDQFGIYKLYYSKLGESYLFSNRSGLLFDFGVAETIDCTSLAIQSILHQVEPGYSIYKNIYTTTPASHISINKNNTTFSEYWNKDELLKTGSNKSKIRIEDLANLIKTNFENFIHFTKVKNHAITLTGGKDSRTGLAALLSLEKSPIGFTYGNSASMDAVYARMLAESISIPHFSLNPPDSNRYFENTIAEILSYENPEISLHRGHRLFAFKELAQQLNGETAYYAGYMAGEFLMGIYYDDLVFRKHLTDFWDTSKKGSLDAILHRYYHNSDLINMNEVDVRLSKLKTFCESASTKVRQFHGIFEIGIPHHCQDIFLSQHYFKYTYPFFIDLDFLETLFKSNYNFFHTDNKTKNLFKRYQLFELNLKIQHLLAPQMDKIPFAKRGSYNTDEFLKGIFYWVFVKTYRYFFNKKKYPSSYSYGLPFRDFLLEQLIKIKKNQENQLHQLFNIDDAIEELKTMDGNNTEKEMHRFSNIVMLNLQLNHSIRTTTV